MATIDTEAEEQPRKARTYRESEQLRKAQFVLRNQCQFTDAEIRKANMILRKFGAV